MLLTARLSSDLKKIALPLFYLFVLLIFIYWMNTTNLNFKDVPIRSLTESDISFLKAWIKTSELNDDDIRSHIMAVHSEVLASNHVYKCISEFGYLTPRSARHPDYQSVVSAARAAGPSYTVADIGTCFGQDTRALILDGVCPSSILASDLHDFYWRAGLKLYMDEPANRDRRSSLIGAGAESIKQVRTVFGDWATEPGAPVDMGAGYSDSFECVLLMAVLHVLSRRQCECLLGRVCGILRPGGRLIGWAVGSKSGAREWAQTPDGKATRWLHDQHTLEAMLRGAGFAGEVKVTFDESIDDDNSTLQFSALK